MKIGRWDKGVSYDYLFSKLLNLYNQLITIYNTMKDKGIAKRIVYVATAIIQLRNGLRESEAVESFLHFIEAGERKFRIQAKKNNNERWVIIPDFLIQKDLHDAFIYSEIKRDKFRFNYKMWVKNNLQINTHSLRYAFIKKMMDRGVTSDKIAIILGHKKLDTTFRYQQKYDSLRILEDL